jgi:hypothetical protein
LGEDTDAVYARGGAMYSAESGGSRV